MCTQYQGNGAIVTRYRTKVLMVCLAAAISLLLAGSVYANDERVYGRAVNADGKLLFMEEHIVRYENDRIVALKTIYYDSNLKKIGEQVSDFSQGPQFGSYDFKDERLQYNDGARVMSNRILIYCKETPQATAKKKYIKREPGQIVGQGFHQFILTHLDALARGEVISAKLVLPAHMDQFDIQISKSKLENDRLWIRIELDNWFLRLFAPRIEAEYDLGNRRLLSYRGLSMIADESGNNLPVTVSYNYSQHSPVVSSRFKPEGVGREMN